MKLKTIIVSLALFLVCEGLITDLSDADYDRMPDIFSFDDYESCIRENNAVYCLVTLKLEAGHNEPLFHQIQEYSSNGFYHYNHTVLTHGICVPKTCKSFFNNTTFTEEDLTLTLAECLNKTIYNDYKLNAKLSNYQCSNSDHKRDFNYLDVIAVLVVVTILMINLIGSLCHVVCHEELKYLKCFSIIKNWRKLCGENSNNSKYVSLKGLNGLRVITLLMVIVDHTMYGLTNFGDGVHEFEKHYTNFYFRIYAYGIQVVQISFAMSGFLLGYKLSERDDTSGLTWKQIPMIFLFRFMRLTPSYAVVMLLVNTWMRHIGSGPFWNYFVGNVVQGCQKYFWHHMFYINNYVTEDIQCSVPTWHLAADTQVFIVGLLVLCLTRRRILTLSIVFVLGLVGPMVDVWLSDVQPVAVITPEFLRSMSSESFRFSHIRGHNNLPCYIAGVIIGLLVFSWEKEQVKVKSELAAYASNLIPLAIVAVFLSNNLLYDDVSQPSLASKMIFAVAFRVGLTAILALALISITMKIKSIFINFLSWSGWVVPSKLVYSVFLIHMNVIFILSGTRTTKSNFTLPNFVITFCGVTSFSYFLGVFLYILVEAPFNDLLRKSR